jgi:hypothetical protein
MILPAFSGVGKRRQNSSALLHEKSYPRVGFPPFFSAHDRSRTSFSHEAEKGERCYRIGEQWPSDKGLCRRETICYDTRMKHEDKHRRKRR